MGSSARSMCLTSCHVYAISVSDAVVSQSTYLWRRLGEKKEDLTLVSHILAQLSREQVTSSESSGLHERFPICASSCRRMVATPKSGTCQTTTSDLEPQAANRLPLWENCI